VETYCWLALPVASCWVTAQGCVCRLCGDLNNGLAAQFQWRKCALEVSYIWDALYKSTSLPFLPLQNPPTTESPHTTKPVHSKLPLFYCECRETKKMDKLPTRLVTSPATVKSKCKSKSTLSGQVQVGVQVLFKKAKSKSTVLKSKSSTKKRTCKHFLSYTSRPIISLAVID